MGITLQDALKIGKFMECEVIAGHSGLLNIIENITIMEVPDIVQWLKGKELILTSLYSIKDDEDAQNSLIEKLYNAGATALAIKPFHCIETIPESMLHKANEFGFPVIRIPDAVKYLDILSPVTHAILNNKVVLQEDLEQASSILNEISLNSQGIEVFVDTLKYLTKNIITIESQLPFMKIPKLDVNIPPLTKEEISELAIIKHPIRLKRLYGDEIIHCIVAPVIVDHEVYGNITCWERDSKNSEMDLAILEKASRLLSLEFLKLKVKYDVEQQYKNDFIRELLFNTSMHDSDLIEWGQKYSLSNNQKYICILLSLDNESLKNESFMKINDIDSVISKKWDEVLVGHVRDFTCIIFPLEEPAELSFKHQCEAIHGHIKSHLGGRFILRTGIGRVHQGIKGIREGFFQAEKAIKLRTSSKKIKEIIYYDDLGIYRLLNQLVGEKELISFYEDTVGKLVDYDMKNDLNLIKTLEYYFYNNENLKVTSKELYIHVNTLKYRLGRIEALTGYSLRYSDEKTMLYVGLKIHELSTS